MAQQRDSISSKKSQKELRKNKDPEKGDIYSELAEHLNIKTLFSNPPLNQKAFYAQATHAIVNEILSEIND